MNTAPQIQHEFLFGDEVTATTLDGKKVTGNVAGLNFGVGDTLKAADVRTADGEQHAVRPDSLRYVVDRHGFYFKIDPKHGTLTIGRNDAGLLDPAWLRRKGAKQLYQSLRPSKRRRGQ